MNPLDKHFGRLGNRMFQSAFFYAYARDNGIDYYFQDEKWFRKYAKELRVMFGEEINFDSRVGIQVRRGDFLTNGFDINLSETDYYQKAVAKFPNERFLVTSDDLEWCRKQFIGPQYDFSALTDAYEALKELAACKHQIIANSSFGWWAAWLNPNPNKIIVCPEFEYKDHKERRMRPLEWIRL